MATVGVVGLGAMGARIAGRLLAGGQRVLVWNRTDRAADDLVASGAERMGSPAEAAAAAEALITMVADPAALRAVVEGPDGLAAGAHPNLTVLEMSTVGPSAISWLRGALPDETVLLDAPVLGSLSEVEAGSLSIFVGGTADVAERWRPLLDQLGEPIHVGPLGSGAAAKLVANTTLFGVLGVLAEAMALGDALGLDRDALFGVLERTPLAAQAARRRQVIESGDAPRRFALRLGRKDTELIASEAAVAGADVPLTEVSRDALAAAEAAGWGERDYSSVIAWILERGRAPSDPSL